MHATHLPTESNFYTTSTLILRPKTSDVHAQRTTQHILVGTHDQKLTLPQLYESYHTITSSLLPSVPPAARVHGAGDSFYSAERRLEVASSAAGGVVMGVGLRGATPMGRRKGGTSARTRRTSVMSTMVPIESQTVVVADNLGTPKLSPPGGGKLRAQQSRQARDAAAAAAEGGDSVAKAAEKRDEPLKFYLHNVSKVKLLDASEEVVLGRKIQRGMRYERVRDQLESLKGRAPTYDEWAAAVGLSTDQLLRVLDRTDKAKVAMIQANLRLVVNIAKRYRYRGLPFTDLIQEGTFGLVKGAEKFNPELGFKFSTYATWWIKQSIMRGIADQVCRAYFVPFCDVIASRAFIRVCGRRRGGGGG